MLQSPDTSNAPTDMKRIYLLLSVALPFCLVSNSPRLPEAHISGPGPELFSVDGVHSSILFRVKHLDISYFYGRFNDLSGEIHWAPDHPLDTSVVFTVNSGSVDTGHEGRDGHLRGPDFFAAKEFPTWSFRSTKIEELGEDRFAVTGELSLRGKTKELRFEMLKTGEGRSPKFGRKIGFEAKFTIQRTDFGIDYATGTVGDEVNVTVSIEANHTGGHEHKED